MINIPIILLAAGSSSRMGRPKQLLPWGDQTLIEHQIQTLLKTKKSVNVVLGAHAEQIIPVIKKFNIKIITNDIWENGMGTSVASGANYVAQNYPGSEGVLIALLDQPMITGAYLQKMIGKFQPGKKQIIVSASNDGWEGVPALFDKHYFIEIQNLDGKEGAKKIIRSHPQNVKTLKCGNHCTDMDTPEKYNELLHRFMHLK